MGADLSVTLNTLATSGIVDLHSIAGSDIPTGYTQTMGKRHHIIQFTQQGDHPLTVASNTWYFEGDRRASPQPLLSYTTAVSLFKNDEMTSIKKAFNLPREVNAGDIVAIICAATGQDISMPPSNAKGEVMLDREGMGMMRVSNSAFFTRKLQAAGLLRKRTKRN